MNSQNCCDTGTIANFEAGEPLYFRLGACTNFFMDRGYTVEAMSTHSNDYCPGQVMVKRQNSAPDLTANFGGGFVEGNTGELR